MTSRIFRPFRSRAFWFGVPGLAFLLWGWWLAMGHYSEAGFWGGRPWVIGQVGGEVFAVWNSDGGPDWGNFTAGHEEVTGEWAEEAKNSWERDHEWDPFFHFVFIGYHWPVLAYVASWLLTLAWWQRRKARLLKLHSTPPP